MKTSEGSADGVEVNVDDVGNVVSIAAGPS